MNYRKLVMLTLLAAICFIAISVQRSAADEIRPCRLVPTGVSVFSRLDDAPPHLVRALESRVGEVVPVGAAFDNTDVRRTGKNRRLIFIWKRETRWVVATEHGGLGYNDPVFAFDQNQNNGDQVSFVREEIATPSTVCSTASSLLVVGSLPLNVNTTSKGGAN